MKAIIAICLILAFGLTQGAHVLQPNDANEMLNHLQGNNYNIYILFFNDPNPADQATKDANEDIENRLSGVLSDNPEIFYAKIDNTNENFRKLATVVGVTSTPAVLMIVHGKGVWLSGTNSFLMTDRLRDFLPAFKQASAHHTNPY